LAKKQKKVEVKRTPTKRQLSRWQRQKRIQRIILISASIFFVLLIGFLIFGYVNEQVRPLNEPILKVNNKTYDMKYYVEMLGYVLEGINPAQAYLMADMALGSIARNELVIQYSADLGITISDDEIEEELKKLDLPADEVRRDAYAADTLSQRLISEYFDSQIPENVPQVKVQALCTETEDDAQEIINKLNAGEEFETLAETSSVEPTTKDNKGDLGWLPKGYMGAAWSALADSRLETIAFSLEPGTLSKPVYDPDVIKNGGYWIIEVIEKEGDEKSHIRGILAGSLEKANEIKASLDRGEDFATLAMELSEYESTAENGGDMDWITKDFGDEAIVGLAFTLEPGTVSEPTFDETVPTKGAYWIVKALDKDDERQIDTEVRDSIKSEAFFNWLTEKEQASSIEYLLTEKQKTWAVERALRNSGA
jgi:parvulin-like peptidyl-prolyl isomerase